VTPTEALMRELLDQWQEYLDKYQDYKLDVRDMPVNLEFTLRTKLLREVFGDST
jgi:hypothetical protein